jgi:dTDP-4-dehydrorhamnose 3,5-epimerase-like enzyme
MSHAALTEDLRALGRFGEAPESARTAREGFRKTYGDEHADSLAAAAVLADVLRLTGDHGAARALHQEVWRAQGDIFGAAHTPSRHWPSPIRVATGQDLKLSQATCVRGAVIDVIVDIRVGSPATSGGRPGPAGR